MLNNYNCTERGAGAGLTTFKSAYDYASSKIKLCSVTHSLY